MICDLNVHVANARTGLYINCLSVPLHPSIVIPFLHLGRTYSVTDSSSSSSSANCTAVGHGLSPRLPVLYHASNLFWRWWVCLAGYAGNILIKHQLWAAGLTSFTMFRVEKGVPVDQFILWFPEDMA